MLSIIVKPVRLLFRSLKKLLKSSKTVRNLLYDIENSSGFTSLYEHEKMIADAVRVDHYREAIQRHVKPGDVVVDLGTGTGILSLFAAQQNPGKVYAIDHSDFIEVARRIAENNGLHNIEFVKTNSRNFAPPEKVDIILHEQLGDDLFNENMIENLLELKKRILKDSGEILPGKFELFLEPVSLKQEYRIPFIWEKKIHGLDFGFLMDYPEIGKYKKEGYRFRNINPDAFGYFLCEPSPVLAVDLNNAQDIPRTVEVARRVTRDGTLDGLCLYFRVIFDETNNFDTSPLSTKTHWGNRLFRVETRDCAADEDLVFTLSMDDIADADTWSVSFRRH